MHDSVLSISNVTKTFPGVRALSAVNLDIHSGSIHALLGENGAGKSTLVRIISGEMAPDEGSMIFDGQPYSPRSPQDAMKAGIRVVHQELNLLSQMTVAENLLIDALPRRGFLLDKRTMLSRSRQLLERVGLDVDPMTNVEDLGVAQRQLVEIAKALSTRCKLLILDEPTATLSSRDVNRLFEILRDLRDDGMTTIFISHHLNEVFQIADRLSVLRNGEVVTSSKVSDIDLTGIVKAMVGRSMESEYPFREDIVPSDEVLLDVKGLKFSGNRHELSFTLKKGEILGIAGLVGSKRTETVRAIFGADAKEQGEISIDGKTVTITSPREAIDAGLSLLTEDRKAQGLVLEMSVAQNTSMAHLDGVSHGGLLSSQKERAVAQQYCQDLNIKTPTTEQLVRNLSGGNQQKVIIAKWLFKNSKVLIFDEPTRGIDVGAKYEIYQLLWQLLEQGKGILVISSDLNELLSMCHRILVFSDGAITASYDRADFDQEKILSSAYENYLHS